MSKVFDDLREALEYTVEQIIPQKHGYLVNVRTPTDVFTNMGASVQVVDENRIFESGKFGLTIYLAFDPESVTHDEFEMFNKMPERDQFSDVTYDGIPCFALKLDENIPTALKSISLVMVHLYGCYLSEEVECCVYDEG